MKRAIIAAAFSILVAAPAGAADTPRQTNGSDAGFEQRKAEMLKQIDERMVLIQKEKTCVQAAANPDDIRACRDTVRAEAKKHRQIKR